MYFSCHGRLPITPFDPRGVHGHALLSVLEYLTIFDRTHIQFIKSKILLKTSQELQMLSSVTLNCQVTKIVINPVSQLSVL